MRYFEWTEERLSKLIELRNLGVKADDIATYLGTTKAVLNHKIVALKNANQMTGTAWWKPDRDARLRELHATGCSYADIGKELSCSRSAISGRARRLGLETRKTIPKGRTKTMRPRKTEYVEPSLEAFNASIPFLERKTLMELREGDCRYPMGDPKSSSFRFCGKEGRPYCPTHEFYMVNHEYRTRRAA